MNNHYKSFASWNPKESEFSYDKAPIKKEGFILRARLDTRNEDLKTLCLDLEKQGNKIKLVSIMPEGVYIDVWYRKVD